MTPAGVSSTDQSVRALVVLASDALGSASEARWIVAHATGMSSGDLVARPERAVAPAVADAVHDLVDRRRAGEPLQYVLGTWSFRTLELQVDHRVLIPRPETEQVVAVALDELSAQATFVPEGSRLVAVDLGTGSGAMALSLASEWEFDPASSGTLEVWATDVSKGALELLQVNRDALGTRRPQAADRVRTAQGSWFEALPAELAGDVRLIVSNPPYVSEQQWQALEPVVRDHEPRVALVPGPTGLEGIDSILAEAQRWLAPGGSLVVEMAPAQAGPVTEMARALGYERIDVRVDLAGRERMLVARSPDA